MDPTRTPEGVRIGGDARQRLHDARGYGVPTADNAVLLSPIEAAYLLYRDDISAVDGQGFHTFLGREAGERFLTRLLVYKDLRERGFYLSPRVDGKADFTVFERGSHPSTDDIAYQVRVLEEATSLSIAALEPGVLAMVDEEGEVGYIRVEDYEPSGSRKAYDRQGLQGNLIGSRIVVPDPPESLYTRWFFGQPIAGRDSDGGSLQLSLLEGLHLAEREALDLDTEGIRTHARDIEGQRFERRYRVYQALRSAGAVPKTGFKFGADFRVYHEFEGVDAMGHSDVLVRVQDPMRTISPAAIALDVRLAHGVGKRMVFALTGDSDTTTTWLSVARLTP